MGKLRYYYGCMNSLKTGTLLTKAFQFEQCNCNTILLKPKFDNRSEEVRSRAIKYGRECISFDNDSNLYDIVKNELSLAKKNVVFVDEVNFIEPIQVEQLWKVTKDLDVDVFVYGLKTTYMNSLFRASEKLLILSDTVEEIKSMCAYCYEKATTHLRYINDIAIFDGDDCIVGDINGSEYYVSVCQECWHKARHC